MPDPHPAEQQTLTRPLAPQPASDAVSSGPCGFPAAAPVGTLRRDAEGDEEGRRDGATALGAARRGHGRERGPADRPLRPGHPDAVTASRVEVRRGTYHDSVTLMQVSRQAEELPGVEAAAAVAATPVNLELLARQGFSVQDAGLGPSDLVICVRAADEEAADQAMAQVEALLAGGGAGGGDRRRPGRGGAEVAAGGRPARPRPQPGRAVGAGPAPPLRDRRGAPGRAARVLLLRRARPGHRGRPQAGGGRAGPAAHGPRLRHRHPGRGRPRVRQRRPPRPRRGRRRLRHRHPGGHLPAGRGRGRHLPRHRGRRPRPVPRGRRHHDPARPRPPGRRRRHRTPGGHLQAPRPGGRPPGRGRRRRHRQAGRARLPRPGRPPTPPARRVVRGLAGGRSRLGSRQRVDRRPVPGRPAGRHPGGDPGAVQRGDPLLRGDGGGGRGRGAGRVQHPAAARVAAGRPEPERRAHLRGLRRRRHDRGPGPPDDRPWAAQRALPAGGGRPGHRGGAAGRGPGPRRPPRPCRRARPTGRAGPGRPPGPAVGGGVAVRRRRRPPGPGRPGGHPARRRRPGHPLQRPGGPPRPGRRRPHEHGWDWRRRRPAAAAWRAGQHVVPAWSGTGRSGCGAGPPPPARPDVPGGPGAGLGRRPPGRPDAPGGERP